MKISHFTILALALMASTIIPKSLAESTAKNEASKITIRSLSEIFAIEEGLFVTFPESGPTYVVIRENMEPLTPKRGTPYILPWQRAVTIAGPMDSLKLTPFPATKRTKGFIASQYVPDRFDDDSGLQAEQFLIYQDITTEAIKIGELQDLNKLP